MPWHEEWTLVEPDQLPVWSPGDPVPAQRKRKTDPLEEVTVDIRNLGAGIVAAAQEALDAPSADQPDADR